AAPVHRVGAAHSESDPPPSGIAGESWHPICRAKFNLGRVGSRDQAAHEISIRHFTSADVRINPAVPGELAHIAAGRVRRGRKAILVVTGKKIETRSELSQLRRALNAPRAISRRTQRWQQ